MQKNAEDIKNITLDNWQEKVLDYEGNITIRAGRQVGKSTVIGRKAYNFARRRPGTITLVIAASQRQSSLLFSKIKSLFEEDNADAVKLGIAQRHGDRILTREERSKAEQDFGIYVEQPTLTKIELKNGSKIYCLPTGKTGVYIRGYTIDLLIADEAAYIPESVWLAIMPMIAVSRKQRGMGWIILLSTPFGKGGYFFESFNDPDFRQFHISSEKCTRIPKDFLLKERKRLTKIEYAQEYLGEFVEEWNQFFPSELIKKCATFIEWESEKNKKLNGIYYLGVDIARYGGDENAFVIGELDGDSIKIVKALTTERIATTDTIGRVVELDANFKFRRIFVDDAGVGGGVTDVLIEKLGRRVVGINNASRSVDKDDHKKRILKEDLYSHTLVLMESGKLQMISDLALMKSLREMTYEYTTDRNLRIYGKSSHLAEAMVRCCWALKEKGLKVFIV